MSKTPNYDSKVKQILDGLTPGERMCELTGEKWVMDEEEISWYKKFNVPPSKRSPLTRMRYLTSTFSSGQLWYNKHANTGKPVITYVHPATGIRVLPDEEWFGRDFIDVALDYDSSRPLFDQLWGLRLKVPKGASGNYEKCENSISVFSYGDVNSYFVGACKSKNSLCSIVALDTENSAEVYNSFGVTNSYRVVRCDRVFNCRYIQESKDCVNVFFAFDCRNCENCFGATNQRNKSYIWFNEQLTKEVWEERFKNIDLGDRLAVEREMEQFGSLLDRAIWPENFNDKCMDSIGEYLTDSTNNQYVYTSNGGARNNAWCIWAIGNSEQNFVCADPADAQENYYTAGCANSFRCKYSYVTSRCQNCEYCLDIYDSENCFACIGLRHKQFCILNKQYSEEDYWKLVDEIKTKMLETGVYEDSLPAKFSGAYFPESGATTYYLAPRELGNQMEAHMFDPNSEDAIGEELMKARDVTPISEIPSRAEDVDQLEGKVFKDPTLNRRFGFIKPELDFYKHMHVAPPMEHQIERVRRVILMANSGVMEKGICHHCSKEIMFAKNAMYPTRKIYCKDCYHEHLEKNG